MSAPMRIIQSFVPTISAPWPMTILVPLNSPSHARSFEYHIAHRIRWYPLARDTALRTWGDTHLLGCIPLPFINIEFRCRQGHHFEVKAWPLHYLHLHFLSIIEFCFK